jgi:ABC-type multidrug transport system permease subunit
MLLGGLMIPYSMLPGAAGKLSQLLPATHAMNAFKGLAMGMPADFSAWGSIIVLVLTGVMGFGLALYLFSWDSRNTRRSGPVWLAFLVLLPSILGMLILQ